MSMTKSDLETLILEVCREMGEDMGILALEAPDVDTRLYGEKSGIDSFALVSLITEIEERVCEASGQEINLADDRAMSRLRSPFRRVGTLVEFIQQRLAE